MVCSHARVKKPGPSQINYQVSDGGCVVTVCDTGAASLAPRTRIEGRDEKVTARSGIRVTAEKRSKTVQKRSKMIDNG